MKSSGAGVVGVGLVSCEFMSEGIGRPQVKSGTKISRPSSKLNWQGRLVVLSIHKSVTSIGEVGFLV